MKIQHSRALVSTSKQIADLETDIKAIKETIERTRKLEQKSNLYIYMKRNLDQLKLIEYCIEKVKKDGGVPEYTFTPDGNLLGIKVKTFGTLVIKENSKHVEYKKEALHITHSIINGFKKLLAIAVETDIDFEEANQTKEYLKDPSKFDVASSAAPAAGGRDDPVNEEEQKEESEESDDDMGFGAYD